MQTKDSQKADFKVETIFNYNDVHEMVLEKDGKFEEAMFTNPRGLCFDCFGNLIVCCQLPGKIRKVDFKTKLVSTIFSTQNPEQQNCISLTISNNNTIYFVDFISKAVKRLSPRGEISVIYPATEAQRQQQQLENQNRGDTIYNPIRLELDGSEKFLYIVDLNNHTIKKLEIENCENVQLLCGKPGQPGFIDGIGEDARLYFPFCIAKNKSEDFLLISDYNNQAIRKFELKTRMLRTVYGGNRSKSAITFDQVNIYSPKGIIMDADDNLYVCNGDLNYKNGGSIEKISFRDQRTTTLYKGANVLEKLGNEKRNPLF